MRKLTKNLAFVILLVLVCHTFAGAAGACGGGSKTTGTDKTDTTQTETEAE